MSSSVALAPAAAVVAVDVGKASAAVLVTDAARRRLLGPLEFPMTAAGASPGDHQDAGGAARWPDPGGGGGCGPLSPAVGESGGVAWLAGGGAEPGACV